MNEQIEHNIHNINIEDIDPENRHGCIKQWFGIENFFDFRILMSFQMDEVTIKRIAREAVIQVIEEDRLRIKENARADYERRMVQWKIMCDRHDEIDKLQPFWTWFGEELFRFLFSWDELPGLGWWVLIFMVFYFGSFINVDPNSL